MSRATSAGGSRPDASASVDSVESPASPPVAPAAVGRHRRLLSRVATVLAGVVVLAVLLAPGPENVTPAAVLRIPVEGGAHRRSEVWTVRLSNEDGWRVCGLSKESSLDP